MDLTPFEAFQKYPFRRRRGIIEQIADGIGLNRFFLREGNLPEMPKDPDMILAPTESRLVEIQHLRQSEAIRGKQRLGAHEYYSYEEIVHSHEMQEQFEGGVCFNFYLSPMNLHYVLFPAGGNVLNFDYHPHFCWPILFMKLGEIRNERLVLFIETPNGVPMVVVMVGSFLVSGIECVAQTGNNYHAGDLLGGFKIGSTVMVLFPKDTVEPLVEAGIRLHLAEPFARFL